MAELKEKINDVFNISLSRYHINRIVKDNNYTLKITKIRHLPNKRFCKYVDINEKLKEFYDTIKKYDMRQIICIDETSINALQKRHHCYSKLGKRCVIKTQSQEVFKKYTAIFAICHKGVLGWTLYKKGGMDSNRLKTFLEDNITSKYKNKLIIRHLQFSGTSNEARILI